MLIYIDNSIGEYLSNQRFDTNQELLFSEVATAYYKGKCILTGNLGSLKSLVHYFGSPIQGIFNIILNEYAEIGAVINSVDSIFVISCHDDIAETTLPENVAKKAKLISIEDALIMKWSEGCCLVAENLNDCIFYNTIGNYYCTNNTLNGTRVSFFYENGGGSTITDVLNKCVKMDHFPTLCIGDSDHKYAALGAFQPGYGDTFLSLNRCAKKLKKEGYENSFLLFPLEAHEIENLIPTSILSSLPEGICSSAGLGIIDSLKLINNGNPILYYDFKNGLLCNKSEPYDAYWANIISQIGNEVCVGNCCAVGNDNMLEKSNNYIEAHGISCITLDPYLSQIWLNLGNLLFTWGCAFYPKRA